MCRKIAAVLPVICLLSIFASAHINEDNEELRQFIYDKCVEYSIDEALVCGVIECESGWNPDAVNHDGSCVGLMQINLVNLGYLKKQLGTDDLYDPFQNVEAGIYMLSVYMEKYNDTDMALMCYNCGENGALKLKAQGVDSTYYSRKVQEVMTKYIRAEECVSIDKKFLPAENDEIFHTANVEYRICKE